MAGHLDGLTADLKAEPRDVHWAEATVFHLADLTAGATDESSAVLWVVEWDALLAATTELLLAASTVDPKDELWVGQLAGTMDASWVALWVASRDVKTAVHSVCLTAEKLENRLVGAKAWLKAAWKGPTTAEQKVLLSVDVTAVHSVSWKVETTAVQKGVSSAGMLALTRVGLWVACSAWSLAVEWASLWAAWMVCSKDVS